MYKRVELITENKKDYKFIREHLKKRILFPEGKLETMRDVPEGSSYADTVSKQPGYEFFTPKSYYRWLPACAFTGLKSHGKPLVKSVKNFVYGPAKVEGYTFFSTELTPDAVPAPAPPPEPVQVALPETPAPAMTINLKMPCPNCGKCLEVENGILKMKISQ